VADEVFDLHGLAAESADAHRRAVQGQGRDDRIDAASVGEAGVNHGAGLVDAAADEPDDAVDDLPQVLVVAEADFRQFNAAFALDVNAVEAIDQYVADGLVLEQRLEGPEAEGLVHDLVHQAFLVGAVDQALFVLAQLANEDAHFAADSFRGQDAEVLHVQAVDELLVNADLELAEVRGSFGRLPGVWVRRDGRSRNHRRCGRRA